MNWFRNKSKHKFGAIRTNGFASKLEAAVYNLLLMREKMGEIRDIKCQQTVTLLNVVKWKIDFSAIDIKTDKLFYVEAKGLADNIYKMKLKLYKHDPPAKLEIWMGSYQRPFLAEIVEVQNEDKKTSKSNCKTRRKKKPS